MIKYITFIFILLNFNFLISQENRETDSFHISDEVKTDYTPNYFSNYFSEYYIGKSLNLRLEMQQNTINDFSGTNSLVGYSFLAKQKLTDKLSVLFGPKINLLTLNGKIENITLLSTFGIQYDVNESFTLESRIDFNLTPKNSVNSIYNLGDGVFYKLGGRLKF